MKKYYIEFVEDGVNEAYAIQTTWFDTKKEAKKFLYNNFDFITGRFTVYLMTAKSCCDDFFTDYDIIKSEKIY